MTKLSAKFIDTPPGTNLVFGADFAYKQKVASETTSGSIFTVYDTLTFNVSSSGSNAYRVNADFVWGHNSASNDIRVQLIIDGQAERELRIEPKDPGTDQRYQNNILIYLENLSVGNHTVELAYRPSSASRISRMYSSVIESWRVA